MLSIGQAAKIVGRSVKTLQRWDRDGVLTAGRTSTGRRVYAVDQLRTFLGETTVTVRDIVAYCRVSTRAQRPDLKNQRELLVQFATARGLANVEYIEEVGGGLNFKREKFLQLVDRVCDGAVSCILVAHKDRLMRFGIELLRHLCEQHDCELLVINDEKLSPEREMVEDLMTIIHCFSSRLYGLRSYKKTLRTALEQP